MTEAQRALLRRLGRWALLGGEVACWGIAVLAVGGLLLWDALADLGGPAARADLERRAEPALLALAAGADAPPERDPKDPIVYPLSPGQGTLRFRLVPPQTDALFGVSGAALVETDPGGRILAVRWENPPRAVSAP